MPNSGSGFGAAGEEPEEGCKRACGAGGWGTAGTGSGSGVRGVGGTAGVRRVNRCHQLKAALRNHFNAAKVQQTTPTITIQAGNMTGSSSVSTTRLKPSTPPNKLRKQVQEDQRNQHRRRRRSSNRRCNRRAPNILNCSHTNRGLSSLLRGATSPEA